MLKIDCYLVAESQDIQSFAATDLAQSSRIFPIPGRDFESLAERKEYVRNRSG